MRISAMTFPALLCAPIALLAIAAIASRSDIGRTPESHMCGMPQGVEQIPLRAGGVRMGEERTFSRLPPGVPSGARDLMFRDADRANFKAVQPFLTRPQISAKIRAEEALQRQKHADFLLVRKTSRGR